MPPIVDDAICIRLWDWSETSQTVSLLTRAHGIVRGIAKGAKREKAPFSGGFELATRGEVVAAIKPDALALLTAWDLRETFPALRATLPDFYAGMLALDLAHHALREHDPHPEVFDALVDALRSLGSGHPSHPLARFLWTLLTQTGHRPQVTADVRTGEVLPDRPVYEFLPREGGLTTLPPDHPTPSPGAGPTWKVRTETVGFLRAIQSGADSSGFSDACAGRAVQLLGYYFREVFQVDPSSLRAFVGTVST